MMQRVTNGLAYTAVLSMVALVVLLFWALFLEEPYLSYQNLPFPPTQAVTRAGEIIPLTVVRCNSSSRVKQYDIAHAIEAIDGSRYFTMPETHIRIEPGCHEGLTLINVVPKEVPPGFYRVIGTATVDGLVRTHLVDWHSSHFEVTQ